MSAEIVNVANGIATVRFSGKLTEPELAALHKRVAEILDTRSRIRILVIADGFQGWEKDGAWGDISFQVKYDRQIECMAIVCDEKWENLALLFASRGFRRFPIEYFPIADLERARAWLAAVPSVPAHPETRKSHAD